MLAFKLLPNNQFIDLRKDASVAITVTGALLDPDHVNRTYSFDFDLSRTDRNDHELKHVHQIDAVYTDSIKSEMILAGLPFTEGELNFTDISETNYRAVFKSNNRKILDELGYEISTFAQETITIAQPLATADIPKAERYKLKFIGLNPDERTTHHLYFGNRNWSVDIFKDYFDYTYGVIIPGQTVTQAAAKMATNINALLGSRRGIPAAQADGEFLILNAWYNTRSDSYTRVNDLVLKAGDNFEVVEFITYDLAVHHHNINQIHTINTNPNADFAFPPISIPNSGLTNFYGVINNVEVTEGKILENTLLTTKTSENILCPMMKVKYVLQKIANRLDLIPSGTWWEHPESSQLIIFNTISLDNYIEYEAPDGKRYLNTFATSFTPGNHLPKMTAKDFVNYICQNFGLKMSVKRGHLRFDFKKDAYNAIPRNFTPFIEPKTLTFSKKENLGVKVEYATDSNIVIPNDQLTTYKTKEAADYKTYTLSMMTLPMGYDSIFQIITDRRRISVRMPIYNGKMNELPKAILFYRGIQNFTGSTLYYPYATHDNRDPSVTATLGQWSLTPTALYQNHLRNIVELEAAPTATADFRLTADELIAFERGDYTRLSAYTPRGMLDAVIKQMRVKATSKSMSTVTVEMVRV